MLLEFIYNQRKWLTKDDQPRFKTMHALMLIINVLENLKSKDEEQNVVSFQSFRKRTELKKEKKNGSTDQ
jgi:hypothetical protein